MPCMPSNLPAIQALTAATGLAAGARDVDPGDVRLHCVVRGSGPVLLVTSPVWGAGSSKRQAGPAPPGKERTPVHIDTRGSGGSGQPADRRQLSQAVMADDIDRPREKPATRPHRRVRSLRRQDPRHRACAIEASVRFFEDVRSILARQVVPATALRRQARDDGRLIGVGLIRPARPTHRQVADADTRGCVMGPCGMRAWAGSRNLGAKGGSRVRSAR